MDYSYYDPSQNKVVRMRRVGPPRLKPPGPVPRPPGCGGTWQELIEYELSLTGTWELVESFDPQQPRETTFHEDKKPGEFAPKENSGNAAIQGETEEAGPKIPHRVVVEVLKSLPRGKRWTIREALELTQGLNKDSFTKPYDYAEAVTAAIIGHRWQAGTGRQGYDTANTLTRWLGAAAESYGNPTVLIDAKTRKEGVGYSDKVTERANKASEYLSLRESGQGVLNGIIFHTREGMFFQLGIDHESVGPEFGDKRKRPIIHPKELPQYIDGQGGILPAVMLTSKITWQETEFAGLGEEGIREVNPNLGKILKAILGDVGMEKVQEHLDEQAKKAVQQATERMLNTKTGAEVVVDTVVKKDPARVAVEALLQLGYTREEAERIAKQKKGKK